MSDTSPERSVLISGAGIAGLTAAILLKEQGWNPVVVEREPALPTEGYMMDFAGTGWDVAERMGLTDELRAVRYPIDTFEFVNAHGRPFLRVSLDRVRRALDNRYVYLRRPDLARILCDRAVERGVPVRFGTSIRALDDDADRVRATFENGEEAPFALVVGADGIHSNTRRLAFGAEESFARYLGYYVAAFGLPLAPEVRGRLVIHEEPDRVAWFHALSDDRMVAMLVFRTENLGHVPAAERLPLLRQRYAGAGWITERVLRDVPADTPVYFDSVTQIVMPRWSSGRVCLIGDACGCLTLIAGQGSHMAMAGAYVLANELGRRPGDPVAAFDAYDRFLRPHVERKQRQAAKMAATFVPSVRSRMWLRRLVIRTMFSPVVMRWTFRLFGVRSILRGYHPPAPGRVLATPGSH
jgi:2-polyprenyl-6-methoxyphenol hydroxylase-like FAD-dependent oxidoreductase